MNQIYAIDSTRISHREYWWGTRSPLVLIGWITKWLHIRIPGSTDDPNFESTSPWLIDALPDEIVARFNPLAGQLAALGFHDVACHCFRDPGTQTTIYWATFLHESGTHFARIHQRIWGQSQKIGRALYPMFFTGFTDGTFLVSSSGKPDMLTPSAVTMNRMPGAPTDKLWARHLQLAAAHGTQRMPHRFASAEEALAATERHHILLRDFNLARGVFCPRTPAEQAVADRYAASVAQAQSSGTQHAEVVAELDALQQNKPGWGNTLWILAISIIAFLALGATQWDWKFTLWLIPVLFFHEAGHWVAMRLFHYRNLRMFFIPLFGAAVTGRHWNVPGWKKGIVSLAGPVPGIVVGALLAILALAVKTAWINELAFLLLILNGFNLLPVLPLDGGHVLHATLFCRNRWLDIAFRCAAIAGMLLLGIAGLGRILVYLAIPLAISLPVAFKLGKVVDLLRGTALPPPLPDSDRIPPETAQAIISVLKAEQPKGISNKILAQQTLSVYETLNARPPGVLATFALLMVHGGAFLVALACCFVLVLGKFGGGFDNFISSAIRQPQHLVDCKQPVQQWRGSEADEANSTRHLLVATLPKRANAVEVYSNLTSRLPPTADLSLFGDSLLLSLPVNDAAAKHRWFSVLQAHDKDAFVVASDHSVAMSLFFIAADAKTATNLAQELAAYGAVPGTRLIAPWSPEAKTAAYTNYLQARLAWLRLDKSERDLWTDPALQPLNKRIADATRRGDEAEIASLTEELLQQHKELQAGQHEKLRVELAGSAAAALVDLHKELAGMNYTNNAGRADLLRQIAVQLGEAPQAGSDSSSSTEALPAFLGSARNNGLIVEVPWWNLHNPQAVLPLLLNWLCEHRCTGIKYELHDNNLFDGSNNRSGDEVEPPLD